MKTLAENLTQYAAYHRDRRNIATHFVGIPMIVFAIVLSLALVTFHAGEMTFTLAVVASIGACIYYFSLDFVFGATMAATLLLLCAGASEMTARLAPEATFGWAAGLFAMGWALQFWGHKFEGMKPAFFDDARQLLIGPLFVCAEVFFLFGARLALRRHIEERVGPTVARRAHAAPG